MSRPHSAALTAPRAKMARSVALWVSSIVSPSPAKITAVLADHRAAAQRREADVAALARAGMAVADPDRMVGEVDAAAFRRRLAEQQRRARRRVDLVAVVHLEDLDVEIGVERLRRLAHQGGEQIDAEAHIAGLDDDRMARGGLELLLVVGREAGGADDMDDARLRGEFGEGDASPPGR